MTKINRTDVDNAFNVFSSDHPGLLNTNATTQAAHLGFKAGVEYAERLLRHGSTQQLVERAQAVLAQQCSSPEHTQQLIDLQREAQEALLKEFATLIPQLNHLMTLARTQTS